jgi:hypothetical protein
MKYVWKIVVRGAPDEADRVEGYALAGSMGEALELAGRPGAVAIPQIDKVWPGAEGQNFLALRMCMEKQNSVED